MTTNRNLILFIPDPVVGGVSKNFIIICNYLITKFKSISVITVDHRIRKKLNKKIKIISPKKKNFINKGIYMKYYICIYLLIKELIINKNNVIFTFQGNWYSILIAKIFGTKIITRSNTSPFGWSNNKIKNFLYKIILKLSDEIIVNSYEFKRNIKKKFNLNSKVIYNPLDKDKIIKFSKKKISFPFFKNKKCVKIINYGRLTDQKNHILLLKAILKVKNRINLRLLIAGDGPEKDKIKHFINKKNLTKEVKLMNFLNNPYPYLRMSDIFILTSNFEGLPNVLLESQTLKKVIISSDCSSGPKEILKNGRFGYLFKTGDSTNLAKKILECIKNKRINNKMIQFGYQNLFRFKNEKNLVKYNQILSKYL